MFYKPPSHPNNSNLKQQIKSGLHDKQTTLTKRAVTFLSAANQWVTTVSASSFPVNTSCLPKRTLLLSVQFCTLVLLVWSDNCCNKMPVSQSKLTRLTPNLGILWILVCSFWLCGSIVATPIIYRLVPSPSWHEIRQYSI